MTDKVYVVTDLGPGDGGKGGVVHAVGTMRRAHTIIKRGGAQGSHGVRTSRGESFDFSQWGCGTFEGIPTHLSEQMIVSPEGLLNEAAALRQGHGIDRPFDLLTVDERAVCATPLHGVTSRLRELARGHDPRGTVGTGVGEAYRLYRHSPELAITAGVLAQTGLRDRLAAIRDQLRIDLESTLDGTFLAEDRPERDELVRLLRDDGFLAFIAGRFAEAAAQATIVNTDYLGSVILARPGVAVVEGSHGVLTDRQVGFYPHTSAIRTLPRFTHGMLRSAGYDGPIVQLGVTRAYTVRHGAGPMPTASQAFTQRVLPGSDADYNRYQGSVRAGPLDFVLLRYAIAACGGPEVFDGLAVTCADQIIPTGSWQYCSRYADPNPRFFTSSGIRFDGEQQTLADRSELTKSLFQARPVVSAQPFDLATGLETQYQLCMATVAAQTAVAVRLLSFGPTERDKWYL